MRTEQRAHIASCFAALTQAAAENPYAWLREALGDVAIGEVREDNRIISEPYTKPMTTFPNVDQGTAILVTSLAAAREAGVEDRAIYILAGASKTELSPCARPALSDSPAMRAASDAVFESAGIGVDDVTHFDLYSSFPSAVQVAANILGLSLDEPRGLTLTGGLPYFGGPGNKDSNHAIASLVDRLRESGGVGYVGSNGGFLSKHSIGL
jgi:acetyl-CoA C-acetyltransferase